MAPTLQELLDRALAGCPRSLNDLFQAVRPTLRAQADCPHVLQHMLDPSDLVQQTLGHAATAFPDFRGTTAAELLAWLEAILRNTTLHAVGHAIADKRDARREQRLPDHPLPSDEATPSKHAAANEMAERWDNALASIPDDHRRVLVLKRQLLNYRAVAEAMGRSEEAVRKLHDRALRRCAEIAGIR